MKQLDMAERIHALEISYELPDRTQPFHGGEPA